jgi:HEAT repeat protein
VISDSLLGLAIVVLGLAIGAGVALLLVHGAVVALERLIRAPRVRRSRTAVLEAARTGHAGVDVARALGAIPREQALALLDELAPSLAGPEYAALSAAARERGLIADAERRCSSRRWRRRLHAVRVLALLGGGERSVPPLLSDPRVEVRAQAAEWAAANPSPEVVERLVAMLADPGTFARLTAMDSLIRIGAAAVAPLGVAIVTGAGGRAALQVAARIGDPRLAEPAQARIDDDDPAVRAWVARILGGLGGERHAAAVAAMLDDPAPEVRAAAAIALGRLGHWPAAPAVAARLSDRTWQVRRDAALALRALGAPGALLLERALRDEDPFARDMARQTLDLPEAVLPA